MDKNLFKNDLVRCKHKHKGLHVPQQGVKLGIWMEALLEASFMLWLIYLDSILTLEPSPKSKLLSTKKSRVSLNPME